MKQANGRKRNAKTGNTAPTHYCDGCGNVYSSRYAMKRHKEYCKAERLAIMYGRGA